MERLLLINGILLIVLLLILCVAGVLFIIRNFLQKKSKNSGDQKTDYWYELAFKDDLTGLLNRNAYNRRLKELESYNFTGIWILLFDIDDFKDINDTKGHLFGDKMIICAADRLRRVFSSSHHSIYRIGGDEFVVISENVREEEIVGLLLKLKEFENNDMEFRFSKGYSAVGSEQNGGVKRAFFNADEMLYADKNSKKTKS